MNYRDIFKHKYEAYYIQDPDTGELTAVERQECFDFTGCAERVPFYAPEDSPIIVRLANNEYGRSIERACLRDVWVYIQRVRRGVEPPMVSVETCRDKDNENFVYDIPDTTTDIHQTVEDEAYIDFLADKLSAEEFSLLMAWRAEISISDYTRMKLHEFPGVTEATLNKRYQRLWHKVAAKAQTLRQEWDGQ